jgi:hypothetical protein
MRLCFVTPNREGFFAGFSWAYHPIEGAFKHGFFRYYDLSVLQNRPTLKIKRAERVSKAACSRLRNPFCSLRSGRGGLQPLLKLVLLFKVREGVREKWLIQGGAFVLL